MSSPKLWKSYFKNSYLLPVFSGLILSITLFYPQLFFFLFVFLLPFFLFLENAQTKRRAFVGGFFFGLSAVLLSLLLGLWPSPEFFYFLKISQNSGNINIPNLLRFTIFLFFFSAPVIALIYGLFSLGVFFFRKNNIYFLINVPLLWILTEFFRRKILFDLSWGDIGYTLIEATFFVNTAKIWGKYGLAFWIIFINVLIYLLLTKKINIKIGFGLLLFVFFFINLLGFYLIKNISAEKKIKIAVLQGYILGKTDVWLISDNSFFFPPPYDELLKKIKELNFKPDIILLPEEALFFHSVVVDPYNRVIDNSIYFLTEKENILKVLRETGAKIFIIGQPTSLPNYQTLGNSTLGNSFIIFDSQGNSSVYTKKRLFPFLERTPLFSKLGFSGKEYSPGKISPYFQINGLNFILVSCIEIENDGLFNKYLKDEANLILSGGSEISLGEKARRYQLLLTRFRAIEQNKFFVRATKKGFSAIVGPTGEIIARVSSSNNNGLLLSEVYLIKGKSFYSKIGEWPIILLSLSVVFFSFLKVKFSSELKKFEHTLSKLKEE